MTGPPKTPLAVLISGRGSNLRALAEAAHAPDYPAEIVLVVSNRPEAAGLEWAKAQGFATVTIDHRAFATREAFEDQVQAALRGAGTQLIACAGFLRLMTASFVEAWRDRMINIHPSLLPSFKGLHTHERVLAAGVKITGCSVHLVRPEMDDGPILAQAAVPVLETDTPEALAARVLAAEHRLYPAALKRYLTGRTNPIGDIDALVNQTSVLYSPALPNAGTKSG